VHLRRNIFGTDICIVTRKGVSLETKRADPQLCADIDITERVENGSAWGLADNRLILEERLVELL
jgi:hypothetical protein